jgi:hypothetical protein
LCLLLNARIIISLLEFRVSRKIYGASYMNLKRTLQTRAFLLLPRAKRETRMHTLLGCEIESGQLLNLLLKRYIHSHKRCSCASTRTGAIYLRHFCGNNSRGDKFPGVFVLSEKCTRARWLCYTPISCPKASSNKRRNGSKNSLRESS